MKRFQLYTIIQIPSLKTNQVFYLGYDKSGEEYAWYTSEHPAADYSKNMAEKIKAEFLELFPEIEVYLKEI